jgi:uncharacterized protein (TIGR02996 family)
MGRAQETTTLLFVNPRANHANSLASWPPMPRFEREEDRRFWEIHVDADGKTVHSRAGMIGSDGRPSKRQAFDTKKAAAVEMKQRITEQLAKGYTPLPDWDEPASADLLAAIAADPTNVGSYLVYADWLQLKRHPRGELTVLQSARAAKPDDKKLQKAEAALLEKYPKLAPPRCTEASKKSRKKHPTWSTTELRWENGFIASARIARFFSEPPFTIRELVVELLEHPAGRFLRRLELGIRGDEDGVVSYVDVIAELARLAPPSLRSLSVVEAPSDAPQLPFCELGPLDDMLAAMPSLEQLHLAGQKMSFGDREMKGLKRLSVLMTDPTALTSLIAGNFPALESLELDCGEAALAPAAVEQLFLGARLPKLKKLALTRTAQTDVLITPLAKSELLPRLTELSLAGGRLSSEGANTLLLRKSDFAHLVSLDLSNNELVAIRELSSVCKQVVSAPQRTRAAVAISDADLAKLSQDSATFAKARQLAKADKWEELGKKPPATFWGRIEGSEGVYDVTYSPAAADTTCTCFATAYRGRACKHGVALAMLVASGHPFRGD